MCRPSQKKIALVLTWVARCDTHGTHGYSGAPVHDESVLVVLFHWVGFIGFYLVAVRVGFIVCEAALRFGDGGLGNVAGMDMGIVLHGVGRI